MKTGFLFLFIFWTVFQSIASTSSSDIFFRLRNLKVTGSVLYIAAHPDDENTRLISYLTKNRGYRVGYLSLTRGDGGQNLIGTEQGEELGILRTQELLAARRIDGAEQFFTRAFDFGYSKNPEETFRKWNKKEILEDVVWVIRYFKPDVIVCRFPTTGEGGHGHHTASAILAEEAFDLANDPNAFPEQIKYLGLWKTERLFWNTFNFGTTNTTAPDQLKIDVGGFNALLGKSYGEIAAEARSQHRCQAFGTEKRRGEQLEFFKLIKGSKASSDLMEGITTDWSRYENGKKINELIAKMENSFSPLYPEKSIPLLNQLKSHISKLNPFTTSKWRFYKIKQIDQLIADCAGLFVDIISVNAFACNGDSAALKIQLINRSNATIKIDSVNTSFGGLSYTDLGIQNGILQPNKFYNIEKKFLVKDLPITHPYRHRYSNQNNYLKLPWKERANQWRPEYRPEIFVTSSFYINDAYVTIPSEIRHKTIDPSIGEVYQPFYISPAASVNFKDEIVLINSTSKKIKLVVKSFRENNDVIVHLNLPPVWDFAPGYSNDQSLSFEHANETKEIEFEFRPHGASGDESFTLSAYVKVKDRIYPFAFHKVSYEHIPDQIWFDSSQVKCVRIALASKPKRIGYLDGAGDKIPDILGQLGHQITLLNESDIQTNDLSQFNAIIIGVRAFNTIKSLKFLNDKLFKYVYSGGKLLVQYNTSTPLVTNELGPFPFKLTRERVTDENAAVTIKRTVNAGFLSLPNLITENDFKDWVQERGLYFVGEADTNYIKPFLMNDPDAKPLDGSLLFANYGKGRYVYTSLSFFRQLPAGVPGAIRLFENLISDSEVLHTASSTQSNGK